MSPKKSSGHYAPIQTHDDTNSNTHCNDTLYKYKFPFKTKSKEVVQKPPEK